MAETKTPRVDGCAFRFVDLSPDEQDNKNGEYCSADVARDIELKLAEARDVVREWGEAELHYNHVALLHDGVPNVLVMEAHKRLAAAKDAARAFLNPEVKND